jgi:hypothetical protein
MTNQDMLHSQKLQSLTHFSLRAVGLRPNKHQAGVVLVVLKAGQQQRTEAPSIMLLVGCGAFGMAMSHLGCRSRRWGRCG